MFDRSLRFFSQAATEAVEGAIPIIILPRRQESLDKLVYLLNISSP
ncbi:hypothetical protein C4K17_4026 [Pseudomonas chlororaphis subsp. aurantiaca]|nr:hypothetical protein C4K17_4026 [Pseudomonas chlororaphis subsp. aurantiaca]